MTTLRTQNSKCYICGGESINRVLGSTNAFGSSDLDTRPPQMQRNTMRFWVQECPYCGYVNSSIEKPTKICIKFLMRKKYRSCSGIKFKSPLAQRFYRHYLIKCAERNTRRAFTAALHAAWACDDMKDLKNAIHCRKLAIIEIEKLLKVETEESELENLKTLRADLLRRALLFDLVIKEYDATEFTNELFRDIIAFQIQKCKEQNADCFTVADAKK